MRICFFCRSVLYFEDRHGARFEFFMDRHTQVRNFLNLGIIYGENNIMDDVQNNQMAEHK